MTAEDRAEPDYEETERQLGELLRGVDDPIAAMASFCSLLHERLPAASWTGFYRVVGEGLLRVGPYQGPPGCLEIPFDRGVCGKAASRGRSVIVDDVQAFDGHIACDPRARSEIVVPVFDADGRLRAVLDVDSHRPAAFDDEDRAALERLVGLLRPAFHATTPGSSDRGPRRPGRSAGSAARR